MSNADLVKLVDRWRTYAATAEPAAAEAVERCASELADLVAGQVGHASPAHSALGGDLLQPPGVLTVGVLDGAAERIVIVGNAAGRYGLQVFSLVPGRSRTVSLPDGRLLPVPLRIHAPSMSLTAVMALAVELTSDRHRDVDPT